MFSDSGVSAGRTGALQKGRSIRCVHPVAIQAAAACRAFGNLKAQVCLQQGGNKAQGVSVVFLSLSSPILFSLSFTGCFYSRDVRRSSH